MLDVKFCEPFAQCCQLFGRKLLNLTFDVLHFTHIAPLVSVTALLRRRQPGGLHLSIAFYLEAAIPCWAADLHGATAASQSWSGQRLCRSGATRYWPSPAAPVVRRPTCQRASLGGLVVRCCPGPC